MTEKVTILTEYLNYVDIFSKELVTKLFKRFNINKHLISLEPSKQPPYAQIYSLKPVELEILKTYIKTTLSNGFIRLSKSPVAALILFVQKLDSSFRLYADYRGLNNLTIKNQCPFPLIKELLD